MLVHCQGGNERSGMAPSIALLLTPARLLQWGNNDYAGYREDFRYSIDTRNDVNVGIFIGENSKYQIPFRRTKNTRLKISEWAIDEKNNTGQKC